MLPREGVGGLEKTEAKQMVLPENVLDLSPIDPNEEVFLCLFMKTKSIPLGFNNWGVLRDNGKK